MECRRAVGLFLPGVKKKKIETYTHTQGESEIERRNDCLRCGVGGGVREREAGVYHWQQEISY